MTAFLTREDKSYHREILRCTSWNQPESYKVHGRTWEIRIHRFTMPEISQLQENTVLAYLQQELADAILAEDTAAEAVFRLKLEDFAEDIEQLEAAQLPKVACKTCTGGSVLKLAPPYPHCASCGAQLDTKGCPVSEEDNDVDGGISYYMRDDEGVPRTITGEPVNGPVESILENY